MSSSVSSFVSGTPKSAGTTIGDFEVTDRRKVGLGTRERSENFRCVQIFQKLVFSKHWNFQKHIQNIGIFKAGSDFCWRRSNWSLLKFFGVFKGSTICLRKIGSNEKYIDESFYHTCFCFIIFVFIHTKCSLGSGMSRDVSQLFQVGI